MLNRCSTVPSTIFWIYLFQAVPIISFFTSANDPWNPTPQNGSGLGSHPDSAFSPLAVNSKFNSSQNNDPWSLGGAALPVGGMELTSSKEMMDPFSPSAQKHLHEFDLLREEIDRHTPATLAATGWLVLLTF